MVRFLLLSIGLLAAGCGDDATRTTDDAGAIYDAAMPRDATTRDAAGGPDGSRADGASPSGDAAAGDTWDGWAMEFFTTYCTECHSSGTRDYTTIDHVMRDAAAIRCGVSPDALAGCGSLASPRQFPVGSGPKPPDDERRRLVAWIDAGLP